MLGVVHVLPRPGLGGCCSVVADLGSLRLMTLVPAPRGRNEQLRARRRMVMRMVRLRAFLMLIGWWL